MRHKIAPIILVAVMIIASLTINTPSASGGEVGVPEGPPVLVLARVINLSEYGDTDTVAVSSEGVIALRNEWELVLIEPSGEVVRADLKSLGVWPTSFAWYGDMIVVASTGKVALIDPWEQALIDEAPGVGPVPCLLVAGAYAVIGNATLIKVYALSNSSIREIAEVTLEDVASAINVSLTGPAMISVESAAPAGNYAVFVGALVTGNAPDKAFLGVVGEGGLRLFSVDELGLEKITDVPASAGVVGVGGSLIYYASGNEVALLRPSQEGLEVLDTAELEWPYNSYCVGVELGWVLINNYAVLVDTCSPPLGGTDHVVAYVVKVVGDALRVDHTEFLANSLAAGRILNSGGAYSAIITADGLAYLYKSVTTAPHPPAPALMIEEERGVVIVNATSSRDPDGDLKGMIINWGDGHAEAYSDLLAKHPYSSIGCYTINVTLIDQAGNRNTRLARVCVNGVGIATNTTTTTTSSTTTTATQTTPAAGTTTETSPQTTTPTTTTQTGATTSTPQGTETSGTTPTPQKPQPTAFPPAYIVAIASAIAIAAALVAALIGRK